jgi:hypothetical protein
MDSDPNHEPNSGDKKQDFTMAELRTFALHSRSNTVLIRFIHTHVSHYQIKSSFMRPDKIINSSKNQKKKGKKCF